MSTTSRAEEYDLVILGGGTGGTVAAWTFAGQGQQSRAFTFGESETTSRYCCHPPPKASYN